ncbi:MAG: D-glycero-beta-D-manno-heptose-7-phosphate kinase [Burkholderiaceae bacterium]
MPRLSSLGQLSQSESGRIVKPIDHPSFSSARVLVVGDVMLDRYWYGDVERISPEAPVPVVRIQREEYRLGGSANVAFNVFSLGAKVSLLSVVGEDEASQQLEALLSKTGIEPFLGRDADLKTTVKLRIIGRQQQLLRADFEAKPQKEILASQTERFAQLVNTHQAVLFSDYGKGGLAHVKDMIDQAGLAKCPILVDPKGTDYSRYEGASVITPNKSEMQEVVGIWHNEEELKLKAQNLRQSLNLQAVLLTRSEEGMSLFDKEGDFHVKAQAREVFDVTGAGDTVIATLASLMACGFSIREALPWANKAGGIVVGKFGTASLSFKELIA